MFGGVGFKVASNSRVAWLVAGAALVVTLALPAPAFAQVDMPAGAAAGPGGPAGAGPTRGAPPPGAPKDQAPAPSRRGVDLINVRDAIANTMVVAPAPEPQSAEVVATGGVVCVAGCDKANGQIVFHDRRMPMLASVTAPKAVDPALLPSVVTAGASLERGQAEQPVTCLAGCYEPLARRTVASLRASQVARAAPAQPTRTKPRSVADVAPVAALTEAPARTEAPSATSIKDVKLRSAFSSNGARPKARKASTKARLRQLANRPAAYGKIVPVPTSAPKTDGPVSDVASSAPAVASAEPATPATPAAVAAAPSVRKPEKKQAEKPKPLATVSNDWFNRINRERKAEDAKPVD